MKILVYFAGVLLFLNADAQIVPTPACPFNSTSCPTGVGTLINTATFTNTGTGTSMIPSSSTIPGNGSPTTTSVPFPSNPPINVPLPSAGGTAGQQRFQPIGR